MTYFDILSARYATPVSNVETLYQKVGPLPPLFKLLDQQAHESLFLNCPHIQLPEGCIPLIEDVDSNVAAVYTGGPLKGFVTFVPDPAWLPTCHPACRSLDTLLSRLPASDDLMSCPVDFPFRATADELLIPRSSAEEEQDLQIVEDYALPGLVASREETDILHFAYTAIALSNLQHLQEKRTMLLDKHPEITLFLQRVVSIRLRHDAKDE